MPRPRGKRSIVRFSVGLDEKAYSEVSALAAQNDTTVAWIVRRAVDEFINRQAERAEPELPLRRRVVQPATAQRIQPSNKGH